MVSWDMIFQKNQEIFYEILIQGLLYYLGNAKKILEYPSPVFFYGIVIGCSSFEIPYSIC
jgi:hypothetical protein